MTSDREHDQGHSGQLADILSAVARTMQAEPGVEATIGAIVRAAMRYIPGTEDAGVSLLTKRKLRTVAPTSDRVVQIDQLQYRTGEGPCVGAVREHHTYRTGDLRGEKRWPAFGPAAADTGIFSMLSFRLFVTETTLGALNLYSSKKDAFSEQAEDDGRLFASHAAVALVGAQTEAQLQQAIETRDTIGMAKGILMERHDVDQTKAFAMLVEASQTSNLKLHAVAGWLVDSVHPRRQ